MDWHKEPLSLDTRITDTYKTTQNVRRFFKEKTGKDVHFSSEFMAWMKANVGKSLREAVAYYKTIAD